MNRRCFITGLLSAPVVITTPGLLMPVRPVWDVAGWIHIHHDYIVYLNGPIFKKHPVQFNSYRSCLSGFHRLKSTHSPPPGQT